MNLPELQREAHAIAVARGDWDPERTFGDCIADLHIGLSKALEAHREHGLQHGAAAVCDCFQSLGGHSADCPAYGYFDIAVQKPVGVAAKLADVVIRVADMAEWYGVDLSKYNVPPVGKHPNRSFGTWIAGIHWYLGAACQAGAYQWGHEAALDFPRGQEWVDRLGRTVQEVLNMAAHYGIDLDAAIEAMLEYMRR